VHLPGDLVEIDTLDMRPVPGVVLKQFTARDVISKWDVIEAHIRATAASATMFIETLRKRMPFPIKVVQVDGGSEFYAEFEHACQETTSDSLCCLRKVLNSMVQWNGQIELKSFTKSLIAPGPFQNSIPSLSNGNILTTASAPIMPFTINPPCSS
jgi:hypothetical protein